MKAVFQRNYGTPDELEICEVNTPVPGNDEVLVRVHAASVHPDVWHTVTGRPYILRLMGAGFLRPKIPIPGTDMAGVIDTVGKHVTRFQKGDMVFGETTNAMTWSNGGAYAEFVCVPQDLLALKPDNVTFEQAASVPSSGFIVLQNLREGEQLNGQNILVNGAGGGVGVITVQIAKACGARVTAVDHTDKLDMLRRLGADQVIDYTKHDFTLGEIRYDLIFDIPGNQPFPCCQKVLKPNGRYVLIGHEYFGVSGKRMFGIIPYFMKLMFLSRFVKQLRGPKGCSIPGRKEVIGILRSFLEAGKITPLIDSTYPLSETSEALKHMIRDKLLGKVIITVQ